MVLTQLFTFRQPTEYFAHGLTLERESTGAHHGPPAWVFLERQGLLERDMGNSYLAPDAVDDDPMTLLLEHWITHRIAVGPQAGRKVFTQQTRPACEPEDQFGDTVGKVAGFSLYAGVAAKAQERSKRERLCRYISRPVVSEKRLSLTRNGNICYRLKTPYRDGTTPVIYPLDLGKSHFSLPLLQNLYLVHITVGVSNGGTRQRPRRQLDAMVMPLLLRLLLHSLEGLQV